MDRGDVFYRDIPQTLTRPSTAIPAASPTHSGNPSDGSSSGGLLSPLLGGLFHLFDPEPESPNANTRLMLSPITSQLYINTGLTTTVPAEELSVPHVTEPQVVGFLGLFFR